MTGHTGETEVADSGLLDGNDPPLADEWDEFLLRTPGSAHVQSSGWAQVKSLGGLNPYYAIVRRDGRIVAGAQILTRRVSLLGCVGYVPYGPVTEDASPELGAEVLDEIDRQMREHRIRALILQLPAGHNDLAAALEDRRYMPSPFEVAPSATLRLDLTTGADNMLARMRASVRRNIRITTNAGVTMRELRADEVATFHRLYCASAARQGFTPVPLEHVQQQLEVLGAAGVTRMFVAERGTEALGSVLVTCFGETVTYKLPGFSPSGRLRPADFLVWNVITWAAAEGFHWFDFGGVPRGYAADLQAGIDPGDWPERGSAEFKRGFRGELQVFPQPYVAIQNPLLRAIIRHLPSPAFGLRLAQDALGWVRRL